MDNKLLFLKFEAKFHFYFISHGKLQSCNGNGFKMASFFKNVSKEEINAHKTEIETPNIKKDN